jgi:hypothetical protein
VINDGDAPGLAELLEYKLPDAPADIKAGLAVTAVALPVGIAYASVQKSVFIQAYCLLWPTRFSARRAVGPDAATCAVIAAAATFQSKCSRTHPAPRCSLYSQPNLRDGDRNEKRSKITVDVVYIDTHAIPALFLI